MPDTLFALKLSVCVFSRFTESFYYIEHFVLRNSQKLSSDERRKNRRGIP